MCTFNENSIYYHLKVCSDNGRNNSDEIGISGLAAIVVSSLMSQILCWQFLWARAMHEMSWIPFSEFQWPDDACCYLWIKFWFMIQMKTTLEPREELQEMTKVDINKGPV